MSDDDVIDLAKPRRPTRLFQKGTSGNPLGRPPGTPNKVTLIRRQLEDCLPEILETLKQQALGGDMAAIKLLLERTLPPLRASLSAVALPGEAGTLTERGDAIIQAMATGELSPDVGTVMLGALATQVKLIEATELADRIERLETVLQQQKRG